MQAITVPWGLYDLTRRMMPQGAAAPLVTIALRELEFLRDVPLATFPMPQETWTFLDVNFVQKVRVLGISMFQLINNIRWTESEFFCTFKLQMGFLT